MTTQVEMNREVREAGGGLRRLLWLVPLVMLLATAANVVLYLAAGSLFPEVRAWPLLNVGSIAGANVVYLTIATIVFAVIVRRASRPARTYTIVATIALVISMVMPLTAAAGSPPASATTIAVLCLMHVVSYVLSVSLFVRMGID